MTLPEVTTPKALANLPRDRDPFAIAYTTARDAWKRAYQQGRNQMAYQIATNTAGAFYVVETAEGRIVRICRKCEDRANAEQLLRDLARWRF